MKQKFERGEMWLGDCLELMADIPDGSVDMVVTSPPYDNLRTYNNSEAWDWNKFTAIAAELSRVLSNGGVIVWNVADATINGSETGTSFRQVLYFKDTCRLNIHDTMIWQKPDILPLTHNRYEQSFEYMFVLSKGKPKTFNRIKDKINVGSGRKVTGTRRHKNGLNVPLNNLESGKTISEFGARFNIWEIQTNKGIKNNHPATFPLKLANDHILSWSNPGDLVLDPFGGSGTTAVAAHQTDRRYLCIERDVNYYLNSCERVAAL